MNAGAAPRWQVFRGPEEDAPGRASPDALLNRACGAMLGLAIGDALGATVEFMTPCEIAARHGVHDRICGGGWLRLPPGQVTDDTTMTFALAESYLAAGGPPSAADCARAFDGWMRAKPVDIGNTVRRGILHWRRSGEPHVTPSEDAGNGAVMRCLPVALATFGAAPEVIRTAALDQARVTHHNPLSDAATLTVVAMIQDALAGEGIGALIRRAHALVDAHPAFAFRNTRRVENPSGYVVDTLRAVFQAVDGNDGFEATLVDVVNRGGDADTTGAIAGMIMGALVGETSLPRHWRRQVVAEVRRNCVRLASELLVLAPGLKAQAEAGTATV